MIHLCTTGVDGIHGYMDLIKKLFHNPLIFGTTIRPLNDSVPLHPHGNH
jgi:hypothetical protein